MTEQIDNFTNGLRDRLNTIDTRLSSLKATMESAPKETQAVVEAKLHEVKANLDIKRHEFATYRANLQELAEGKQTEIQAKVEEWKTKREIGELNRRAERAEHYAASCVFVSMAAIDEAEEAILEAMTARLDADKVKSADKVADKVTVAA
ncbi:MAG: hypothetical protein NT070_23050 [Cyanobacteria bacterium]|nr:hypothetical protein [Cyanobacteriota bacterium]